MLIVCLSIVITSNVNKSTKKKYAQQKRKELIREVQNFSEKQQINKQKEIIRDYNNFKKQSQSSTNDLKQKITKNLNNLESPKSRAMASKLSNMKKTAKHNDSEFLNEINKNKDEKQLARRVPRVDHQSTYLDFISSRSPKFRL